MHMTAGQHYMYRFLIGLLSTIKEAEKAQETEVCAG